MNRSIGIVSWGKALESIRNFCVRCVPWAEQRLVLLARGLWAGRRLGVPMSAVMEAVKALAGGGVGSIRAARGLRADAGVRAAFRAAMHG